MSVYRPREFVVTREVLDPALLALWREHGALDIVDHDPLRDTFIIHLANDRAAWRVYNAAMLGTGLAGVAAGWEEV